MEGFRDKVPKEFHEFFLENTVKELTCFSEQSLVLTVLENYSQEMIKNFIIQLTEFFSGNMRIEVSCLDYWATKQIHRWHDSQAVSSAKNFPLQVQDENIHSISFGSRRVWKMTFVDILSLRSISRHYVVFLEVCEWADQSVFIGTASLWYPSSFSHTSHNKIDVIRYCNDKLNQEQLFWALLGAHTMSR